VQDEQFKAMPGLVVRVTAGEAHAYENISDQDLMLISVNIPTR
jgi:mannose-6-phosphate isomerase-like protein (cupin superfamily)